MLLPSQGIKKYAETNKDNQLESPCTFISESIMSYSSHYVTSLTDVKFRLCLIHHIMLRPSPGIKRYAEANKDNQLQSPCTFISESIKEHSTSGDASLKETSIIMENGDVISIAEKNWRWCTKCCLQCFLNGRNVFFQMWFF